MKSSKPFLYETYKNTFTGIPDVIEHMLELHEELKDTDLDHLRAFTITYLIITRNVFAKLRTGYFKHMDEMIKLDIVFARYYFDALQRYIETDKTTPAWQVLFNRCKDDVLPQFVYMAMGVNAHVNNDLGLSLYDVIDDEGFKTDYAKVNGIISGSLNEVIASVIQEESPLFIDKTSQTLPHLYKLFMNTVIRKWRQNAWNNFVSLRENKMHLSAIEQNAAYTAIQLTNIRSILDTQSLYRIMNNSHYPR